MEKPWTLFLIGFDQMRRAVSLQAMRAVANPCAVGRCAWPVVFARSRSPRSEDRHLRRLGLPAWSTSGNAGEVELQGAPAHAAARLRVRAGQCRARYAAHSVVARSSEHPAHRALHRTEPGAVQGVLARPMTRGDARRLGVSVSMTEHKRLTDTRVARWFDFSAQTIWPTLPSSAV